MQPRRTRWLLAALAILLLAALLASRIEELTDGVWTLELIGGCAIDYHISSKTLALACPGVDYTRLWPLPVVQPWAEPADAIYSQLAHGQRGIPVVTDWTLNLRTRGAGSNLFQRQNQNVG
jgi:hypothetical protein